LAKNYPRKADSMALRAGNTNILNCPQAGKFSNFFATKQAKILPKFRFGGELDRSLKVGGRASGERHRKLQSTLYFGVLPTTERRLSVGKWQMP
jgi:hypothetical protein